MAVEVTSEVTGTVFRLLVSVGDKVVSDDTVVILESMKMEIPVTSPADGTITSIPVAEGDSVDAGDVVITLD
jgi:acetyl-CoA carboxylase biotin carboxyl carrier protein